MMNMNVVVPILQ